MSPTPTPTTTMVQLSWGAFIGPVVFAALLTLAGTVLLHFLAAGREDRHRFTADKRTAYVELIVAAREAIAIRNDVADLERQVEGHRLAGMPDPSRLLARLDKLRDRQLIQLHRWESAIATVFLLAPGNVERLTTELVSLGPEELGSIRGMEMVNELIGAMRQDLAIPLDSLIQVSRSGLAPGSGAQNWTSDAMRIDLGGARPSSPSDLSSTTGQERPDLAHDP